MSEKASPIAPRMTCLTFDVVSGGHRVNESIEPREARWGDLLIVRDDDLAFVPTVADPSSLAFHADFDAPGHCSIFLSFDLAGRAEQAVFRLHIRARRERDCD